MSKVKCSASTARCSASLHMGLGSHGPGCSASRRCISCQIEPQEMGTHGYFTVRLWTRGWNIFPPATSLPPYSSSKHETNCGKSNWKSGETSIQRHDIHTLPVQIISKWVITVHGPQSENSMSFSNRLTITHRANDQMVWLKISSSNTYIWLKSPAQLTPRILSCERTLRKWVSIIHYFTRSE